VNEDREIYQAVNTLFRKTKPSCISTVITLHSITSLPSRKSSMSHHHIATVKLEPILFSIFFALVLGALFLDLCLFFLAERQLTAFTLAVFSFFLFPFPTTTRLVLLCATICLQSFIFFSTPYIPLAYLLPSIMVTRYASSRLYQNPLLPAGIFISSLAAQTWLLQPHLLDSTGNLACTFLANFATIIGAWMISLTLRKQGGRGSRPRA